MSRTIDVAPERLAREIEESIASARPTAADVVALQRQLLMRHADLRLKPTISAEEVVEGFIRCALVHHLQQRFALDREAILDCVNSSHKAVRGVCAARDRHAHLGISDEDWSAAWLRLQREHPEVNIPVAGHRNPKRADLYLVAQRQIVSLEFKYVGTHGVRDLAACVAQVRRHGANHALAFLVLYCGGGLRSHDDLPARLDRAGVGDRVRIVRLDGPAISIAGPAI